MHQAQRGADGISIGTGVRGDEEAVPLAQQLEQSGDGALIVWSSIRRRA
jgi:hypothetical protein